MSWDEVESKFETMTSDRYDSTRRAEIIETVKSLDDHQVSDLVALLD
ncbi:MAG: hypothetical protein ABEI52_10360 [Halobacteriaceae archaeon]